MATKYRDTTQFKQATQMHQDMMREDEHRNELFGERGEPSQGGSQPEEVSVNQLVRQAANTHTDTTATARRALKVLNETQYVQEQTMKELESQKNQLTNLDDKLTRVNEDLTYSERILRYMRRCCCCWMCDSCTGADPEEQIKRDWERRVDRGETRENDRPLPRSTGGGTKPPPKKKFGSSSSATNGQEPQYRDPDISLPPEHQSTEVRLHTETRKQNEILDQIHVGLGNLLENARVIGDEVEQQTEEVRAVHERTVNTHGRIAGVNNKSQLRKFKTSDMGALHARIEITQGRIKDASNKSQLRKFKIKKK